MCGPQSNSNVNLELEDDPGSMGGSTSNRKRTDVFALIFAVLFFGTVITLTIYCILSSDTAKLTHGYDDCGNICGRNNIKTDTTPFECFSKNMEQKRYTFIKSNGPQGTTKECVVSCAMQETFLVANYCVSDDKLIPFSIQLVQYWKYLLIIWILTEFMYLPMKLFPKNQIQKYSKFFKDYYIYVLFIIASLMWVYIFFCLKAKHDYFYLLITIAVFVTIAAVSHVPLLVTDDATIKHNLGLVLLQEALNAIHVVPILWLLSPLFFLIIIGLTVVVSYSWICIQSFSYLHETFVEHSNETNIDYVQYPIGTLTGTLLIYAFLVLHEIVKNCQCMIVGGCVAQYYFTKKGELSKPVSKTVTNLLKYHLGTICYGSIALPVVYTIRCVVNGIKGAASGNNQESVYTCSCRLLSETCLATYITCLDCFSQNGFTMTAIYGCDFDDGIIRAHTLITHNCYNLVAVKKLGNFILENLKIASCVYSILIPLSFFMALDYDDRKHRIIFLVICTMLSYVVADCLLSMIKVTMDTIFLCFCEDCLFNNGTTKPYYMSPQFAQFIEKANRYIDLLKWKENEEKWENGPQKLYLVKQI